MSNVAISNRFCLLCYKTVSSSNNTVQTTYNINKFKKIVNRFADQKQNDNIYEYFEDRNLFECCTTCNFIIKNFCENYNQLKLLELKLDFMLDTLVDKINYANKVPGRWKHVNRVLEEFFKNDLAQKAENQDRIRKLRQNIIEAGHQRKVRSKPTVLLNRCENIQLVQPSSPKVPTHPVFKPTTQYSNFGDIEMENDMEYSTEYLTTNMASYDGTTIADHDEGAFYDDIPELENHSCDINDVTAGCEDANCDDDTNNWMTMEGTAIFMDPQIQIKVEHQSLQANAQNDDGTEADDLGLNPLEAISMANNQQSRYSLRKNRATKFTNEIERDDDDISKDVEYNSVDSSSNTIVSSSDSDKELQMKKECDSERPKLKRGRPKSKSTSSSKLDIECKICTKKFNSLLRKDHHFKYCHDLAQSKTGRFYSCQKDGCAAYFLTSVQVRKHRMFDHGKSLKQKAEEKGKQIECPKCDKRFYLKSSLNRHLEYHKNRNEWRHECEICGKKFAIKYRLLKHSRLHTNDKPYQCRFCDTKFSKSVDLNEHLIIKHRDEDFNKDELVNETLIKDGNVRSVSIAGRFLNKCKNSKPLVVECEICTRKFTSFLKKEHHFKLYHDLSRITDNTKVEKCNAIGCTAYFLEKSQLKSHSWCEHGMGGFRKKREKNLKCEKCGKDFMNRHHLKVHLEYHKDPSEWKFECGTCGKKCATESKLKDHVRTHTKERPFQCPFCVEGFGSSSNLKHHLKRWHKDKEEIKAELDGKYAQVTNAKVAGAKLKCAKVKDVVAFEHSVVLKLEAETLNANEEKMGN